MIETGKLKLFDSANEYFHSLLISNNPMNPGILADSVTSSKIAQKASKYYLLSFFKELVA